MPARKKNDATAGHVDDLIELFALGALEREATVAAVAPQEALGRRISSSARETKTRGPRRNAFIAYAALAATLLFAVGTGFEVRAIFDLRRATAENDVALVALVNSHFTHQTFEKVVPTAPTAKVLVGRSPHWLYVIVESPRCRCSVFATTASGVRDLGQPVPHERTSTLFVPDIVASRVDLRGDGRTLSTVRFVSAGRSARRRTRGNGRTAVTPR